MSVVDWPANMYTFKFKSEINLDITNISPTLACSIYTQTSFYKLVFCLHMQAITTKTIEKKIEFI